MQTSLHHYMKVGLVHFMAYPVIKGDGPVLESLKKILEDPYFEVIEISWIKDAELRKQAKALLDTSGITVKYGAQPRLLTQKLDINALDHAARQAAIEEMKRAIDDAADLGIDGVALLSGPYPGDTLKSRAMDALEDSLVKLCAYAQDKNINIVLEIFDRSIDKKCLIGPASDAAEIGERVRAKASNFGLMADLSHTPMNGESPADALRPIAHLLTHIHIGNCYIKDTGDPAYGDMHPRFGYPGGANDVPEIVEFLRELFNIGYLKENAATRPIVTFEIKPVGGEDTELVIANAKRKLNEAWTILLREKGL